MCSLTPLEQRCARQDALRAAQDTVAMSKSSAQARKLLAQAARNPLNPKHFWTGFTGSQVLVSARVIGHFPTLWKGSRRVEHVVSTSTLARFCDAACAAPALRRSAPAPDRRLRLEARTTSSLTLDKRCYNSRMPSAQQSRQETKRAVYHLSLPPLLLRNVKAKAALQDDSIRRVIIRLLEKYVEDEVEVEGGDNAQR